MAKSRLAPLKAMMIHHFSHAKLHHFSDASSQGYGAVLYLQQIDGNGKVHCSLIMAKSRLAPLKSNDDLQQF